MTLLDRGTVRRVPPGDLVVDVADSRLGCVDAQHGDVVAYYELHKRWMDGWVDEWVRICVCVCDNGGGCVDGGERACVCERRRRGCVWRETGRLFRHIVFFTMTPIL